MKVTLTIELELPDELGGTSSAEVSQIVFDAYVNYVTCQHLHDRLTWLVKSLDKDHTNPTDCLKISEYHKTWADICERSTWKIACSGLAQPG